VSERRGRVDVWIVDLLQPISVVDAVRAWLDDREIRSAASRRDDVLRNRYVVAHGAVRAILGERLGVAPDAVEIERGCVHCGDPAHGRPEVGGVVPGGGDLSFSLSHSESLAMVAVYAGPRIGVDVEIERPRPRLDALAARVLSAEEHAHWLDAEAPARLRTFLEMWTAKEAYLKAIGTGITSALRDVPRRVDGWTITAIPSPPGTVASIAAEGEVTVELAQWTPPVVAERARVGDPGGRPIDKFRGTAVGGVLAAGLLGLRDAIEPRRDEEVAIVRDDAGGPPKKDPILLELDPEHPEESVVRIRPWLRDPPADSR
jgi:4'-phosphopantetheinyl transferase